MQVDADSVRPLVRPHPSRDGLQLVDPIDDRQFTMLMPSPVDPVDASTDTDRFSFPVETVATVETCALETQEAVSTWIRDESGTMVTSVIEQGSATVPPGRYNVELSTSQLKVYLAVESGLTVEFHEDRTCIDFGDSTRVHVGARSFHEHPVATVTTTDDPVDVMAAVSTFGSALKTTTCERSFPTLRGHPPLVERGDERTIPASIDTPETGLTIEVPPELAAIYSVAPLAYYLGATVRPGSTPRLVADDWEYSLDGDAGFGLAATRLLRRVLLLDCVTRTEGYYDVELRARTVVEPETDLDFEWLYDQPVAEQVRRYLEVPESALADAYPKWKVTADVRPDPEYVGTLPFLATELALVRCPTTPGIDLDRIETATERADSMFLDGQPCSSAAISSDLVADTVFLPAATDSIEQVYVGDGIPFGASKMTVDAYHRRLEYDVSEEPEIEVVVVCNDERMAEENAVSNIYGQREWVEFDCTFRSGLSTAEMRALLRTSTDFLHFIGHVDEAGIRCTDGHLDTRDLSTVNVDAFMLNACNSYAQGYGLVENGAMAGIATVADVHHEAAMAVGKTVAKLLNQGFSLASTLPILERHSNFEDQYAIIGDGSLAIVGSESGTPYHVELDELRDDEATFTLFGYPQLPTPMGTLVNFYASDEFYINSGELCTAELGREEFAEFLRMEQTPVLTDEVLVWSRTYSERFIE